MKHDYSLEVMFKFLDKDKSDGINIVELTKGLKDLLSEQECRILFVAVDKDHSGEISYVELINECSKINCGYVLQKMKNTL
jgi:Ca2+-binding EF-hand superfamily protein